MEYIWDLILNNFFGILLIFSRVTGIFTFNPIFGRQNVPMRVRVALSMVLAVIMTAYLGGSGGISYVPSSIIGFVLTLILEALIGLVFGFITNLFLTVLMYAGEIIDTQIGLSMAKAMDPSTGVTMPVFANFYYYLFIIYFFITDGHLQYIKLFALSYDMIPIGYSMTENTVNLTHTIALFLGIIMVLAVKLALPVLASELIIEFCVGVIMKAVPTIQIFVINIQLKIIAGIMVLMVVTIPISDFIDNLLNIMWKNLDFVLTNFI